MSTWFSIRWRKKNLKQLEHYNHALWHPGASQQLSNDSLLEWIKWCLQSWNTETHKKKEASKRNLIYDYSIQYTNGHTVMCNFSMQQLEISFMQHYLCACLSLEAITSPPPLTLSNRRKWPLASSAISGLSVPRPNVPGFLASFTSTAPAQVASFMTLPHHDNVQC